MVRDPRFQVGDVLYSVGPLSEQVRLDLVLTPHGPQVRVAVTRIEGPDHSETLYSKLTVAEFRVMAEGMLNALKGDTAQSWMRP